MPANKNTTEPATGKPLRFAHPFYTDTPITQRASIPGTGNRMLDFVATKLLPFPDPQREPSMLLSDIIGQQGASDIQAEQFFCFHAVGDTGHENGLAQEQVSTAMAHDYNPAHPAQSPAFLLHLGDVIYYDNTDKGYQAQFYVPYKKYPGKIIAIPGNHDGEIFKFDGTPTGQKASLAAFWRNFCQSKPGVPPDAGTIYREMISQPGAYWWLNAPFIDIIGLYSNIGEGPGFINVPTVGGLKQTDWLKKILTAIQKQRTGGQRKALLIAVHHPPFSQGGHSGSSAMLQDIDKCCTQSGIMPDMVLAAHAHNYQRFTRYMNFGGKNMQIPFYVAGCGGRGLVAVSQATGKRQGDNSFDSSLMGYGYLTITASPKQLSALFTQVDAQGARSQFDKKIVVDLNTSQIL